MRDSQGVDGHLFIENWWLPVVVADAEAFGEIEYCERHETNWEKDWQGSSIEEGHKDCGQDSGVSEMDHVNWSAVDVDILLDTLLACLEGIF